VKGDR